MLRAEACSNSDGHDAPSTFAFNSSELFLPPLIPPNEFPTLPPGSLAGCFHAAQIGSRTLAVHVQLNARNAEPRVLSLEAKRLFDTALMARDPKVRVRWIERANQYLLLADTLPEVEVRPPEPCADPAQQKHYARRRVDIFCELIQKVRRHGSLLLSLKAGR